MSATISFELNTQHKQKRLTTLLILTRLPADDFGARRTPHLSRLLRLWILLLFWRWFYSHDITSVYVRASKFLHKLRTLFGSFWFSFASSKLDVNTSSITGFLLNYPDLLGSDNRLWQEFILSFRCHSSKANGFIFIKKKKKGGLFHKDGRRIRHRLSEWSKDWSSAWDSQAFR